MTESGKTTLAKSMARNLQARGWYVVVLDPIKDPGWQADYIAADVNDLLYILKQSRSCFVFVDEAGQVCGHHDTDNLWLATQSRHWGHSVFFISQRGSQLSKTIREQCSFLYLFACSKTDSAVLANEWNREKLLEANTLKRGEYLYAPRFKEVKKYSIFINGKRDSDTRSLGNPTTQDFRTENIGT